MDTYGPPLPPGFQLSNNESNSYDDNEPPVKTAKVIGPQIPKLLLQNKKCLDSDNSKDIEKGIIDSALPPSSERNNADGCLQRLNSEGERDNEERLLIGPVLPSLSSNKKDESDLDSDNEIYGPMPSQNKVDYDVIDMIEKRAANMKDQLHEKRVPSKEVAHREEWMVLPDTSSRNQLGAISRCLAPGSKRSKKEERLSCNKEEDKKTREKLKKYNKSKRSESLLDIHRKKQKKKKEKEKSPKHKERKAFDREEVGVRYFTKQQVNSVIDKAKYLNSRFAPGKSEQFL